MSVLLDSSSAPPVPDARDPSEPLQNASATSPALADESIMAVEASPWRTQKLNRRPIIALGVVVVALCCLMGYAALQRYADSNVDTSARPTSADEPRLPRGTDSRRMANDIIGTPRLGLIPDAVAPASQAPAPEAAEQKVPVLSVVDEEPPRPPRDALADGTRAQTTEEADELHKARQSALREALVAPRTIRFDRRPQDPAQGDFVQRELARVAAQRAALEGPSDPAAAYQQVAAQAAQIVAAQTNSAQAPDGSGGMPFPASPPGGQGVSPSARNDLRAFGKSGSQDRWQLPSQVENPPSPYMVQVGSVIGAVLVSAVNSELPGPLIAHVSQPVYSSTGRRELLIPQGTAIFGEYSSNVVFGQDRLLVAWQRLRFPNGQTLDIGAMPGTDGVGRSGFEDQVDHHYFRLFASALLLSLVTTGVTQTQTPSSSGADRMSVGAAMSQSLGLQFGQVTSQLLQKNMNIAPTIEIRNGFRFNIVVTKDLVFPGPYPAR